MARKSDPVVTEAEHAQRRADAKLMSKPTAAIPHQPEHLGAETGAGAEVPASSDRDVASGPSATIEGKPRTEAGDQEHEHSHAAVVHTHDHYHVTHHHTGGVLGEFEHRTRYHLHEHNHATLVHAHESQKEDERSDHESAAHTHDHDSPTGGIQNG